MTNIQVVGAKPSDKVSQVLPILRLRNLVILVAMLALFPGQVQADDSVAIRKYSIALGFQRKGLHAEAEKRWQEFIKGYPKHANLAKAHYHLGVCQLQQKKFGPAMATFELVQTKFPQFAQRDHAQFNIGLAQYNQASASKKAADFHKAIVAFQQIAARYPKSAILDRGLYYQAECHCLAGELEKALPIYQQIVDKYPKGPFAAQALFSLGATYQDLKRDAEAITTLASLKSKFPKDPLVHDANLRTGISLMNQKKFAEAEKIFAQTAAIKTYPLADFAALKHARSLLEQKKDAPAVAVYESFASRYPESELIGDAFLAAGKVRLRLKQYPQAVGALTQIINRKLPDAPEASYWLAQAYIQQNNPNEAIKRLDQAIKLYPKSPFLPLCQYGRIEAIQQIAARRKEAIALFLDFAAKNPKHEKAPAALLQAAVGSFEIGDINNTRAHCQKFLANAEYAKSDLAANVLATAAESYLQTPADPAKAEAMYRQVLTSFPKHPAVANAQVGIGSALYAQKKWDPAIQHLQKQEPALKAVELKAECRLLIGRSQLAAGRPKEAIGSLRNALAVAPKWAGIDEVLFVLAMSLQANNESEPAIAELNRLISQHPKSTYRDQAFYQSGDIRRLQKNYPAAIGQFDQVVKAYPKSDFVPAALYGMASSYFEQKDLPNTLSRLNTILSAHKTSPIVAEALYLRGLTYQQMKNFPAAVKDLQGFLGRNPQGTPKAAAQFSLAQCLSSTKQPGPAVAYLEKIIAEQPKYERMDQVLYELGFAQLDLKNSKAARDAFQRLAAEHPMSSRAPECWYRVAELWEQDNKLTEAMQAIAEGLKRTEKHPVRERLWFRQASLQFKARQFDNASASAAALIKEFASGELVFQARTLVAECAYEKGEFDQALKTFQEIAASKDPKAQSVIARSLYRSGLCAAQLKQWEPSREYFSQLVTKFPKFEQVHEARYGIGFALQNLKKVDEALPVFKQITDEAPNTISAAKSWFMMGQCHFSKKQYQQAIDCFTEVAFGYKHPEWQPLSYFEAGRCYIQLKNPDAARKMLNTVIKEFGQHPRAKDAQTILDQLK